VKLVVEIDETILRRLVCEHLADKLGNVTLSPSDILIEVKSKQNYRSEWESAAFRARVAKIDA
jgi:hypothetical protein